MIEQRIAERKKFTRPLDFKVSTVESGTVIRKSRGVDISSCGLGMTSDYRLTQGMVLRISLPVDDIGITLPLFAEVVYVSPIRKSFRTGLVFLR